MDPAVISAFIAAVVSLFAMLVNIKIARDTRQVQREVKIHEDELQIKNENLQSLHSFLSAAESVRIQMYYLAWAVEDHALTPRNERLEEMINDFSESHKKYIEAWSNLRPIVNDERAIFFSHSRHRQGGSSGSQGTLS